jgi:putative addiction module component (TIGR02574 family)
MANLNFSISDLTPAEKLQLIEDLWNDLSSNPENVPVPDWHKEELDRRKATEGPMRSADDVFRRARERHAR